MAIGYINIAHVSRGEGRSAVGAAAYAARERLYDERTGRWYDYSGGQSDVTFSGVFLPKGAPERFRDRAALWNDAEQTERKSNARTARRLIIALPHELTAKQQQQLLTDFIRENFTRKGLAVDASIHAPDAEGDQRNDHGHLLITTRFVDAKGLTEKDRVSNENASRLKWEAAWAKMVNYQLERHGHAARISFQTPEGQMPQIHLGQSASALERKGVRTRAGDQLRQIVNDNEAARRVANDQTRAVGKEFDYAAGRDFAREVIISPPPPAQRTPIQQPQDWTAGKLFAREDIRPPQRDASNDNRPETIDRDAQAQAAQDAIDSAAIAYAEERRQQFHQTQATDRATFDRHGEEMTARHAATWGEMGQRHQAETVSLFGDAVSGYQPGTMAEAEQAASSGVSFLLGLFTSWAESITRSVSGSSKAQPKRQRGPDRAKEQQTTRQADQLREAHSRELEGMMQEQAREREAYERRRALMLFQQAGALQSFEQAIGDRSSMREAFEKHTEQVDGYKAHQAEKVERTASREGRDRDGPELG